MCIEYLKEELVWAINTLISNVTLLKTGTLKAQNNIVCVVMESLVTM